MVSSRYETDSGGVDSDDAGSALTPESVPENRSGPHSTSNSTAGNAEAVGRQVVENIPFGVVLFDSGQNVVYCNPQHRDLLNLDVIECGGIEAWLRKGCRDPDYAGEVIHSWREHVWRKQLTRVFSLKSADEKLREIEFRSKLLDDGALLLTLFDVTESRRSEDALRLTETKFHTVFEHVSIGVALVDRTGRFFEVNPALESMLAFPRWELRRMALNELVPPEDFELLRKTERELATGVGGHERTLPIHFRRKDGSSVDVEVTISPIRAGSRRPQFTAYFIRDTTAGDAAIREDLRESREQNRALLEAIPDLILLLDGTGRVADLVPASNDWLGPVPGGDTWAGQPVDHLWPEFGESATEMIRKALKSGAVESFSFKGAPIPDEPQPSFTARIVPCGIDQVVAVVTDETRREAAREAISRQSVAFRQLEDGVIVTDLRGRILDLNTAAEVMFGYSASELKGKGLAELYAPPGEEEEFNRAMSRALTEAGEWRCRTEYFRKDGRAGFCEVVVAPVEDGDRPLSLLAFNRDITRETLDDIAAERFQHRIRNQLQMVGSLFGLEAKHRPDSQSEEIRMLEKFQARLRAVTRLQDPRLKGPEFGTVRLAAYARALADDLRRICERRNSPHEPIAVFGDESISATSEAAGPFGLLVVDLGLAIFHTNLRESISGETVLTLIIQPGEAGAPFFEADVSARGIEGISLPIIEGLVSQMRGRLEHTRHGEGWRMTVYFPEIAEEVISEV